ncbi:hypothetical protein J1N35_004683 [Gossypium stocksii]|uniref:DUF4283 domain-containing protein n=1 Tax=Gossypium stocksii TaxID=47602 RepID=A0A9D3WE41_9ROSI|nr:hypothetical protein J1N35_004683 [Gossypium stocksii]
MTNFEDEDIDLLEGDVETGQYLSTQLWSPPFSTAQPYLLKVVAWIRLPGLLNEMYKRSIPHAIGEMMGKIIKVDYMSENGLKVNCAAIPFEGGGLD